VRRPSPEGRVARSPCSPPILHSRISPRRQSHTLSRGAIIGCILFRKKPNERPSPEDEVLTRKAYPPGVEAAREAYLAEHKNATRPPVRVAPVSEKHLADAQAKYRDPAAVAAKLDTFAWKDGVTRIPTGFSTTKAGKKAAAAVAGYVKAKGKRLAYDRQFALFLDCLDDFAKYGKKAAAAFTDYTKVTRAHTAYDRQANADHQHYRRRQATGSSEGTSGSGGSSGHNSAQAVRAIVYSDGSNLSSQANPLGIALDNDLENVCAYPLCLKPLKKDRRSNAQYCVGKDCAQRDRRRLAKLNISDANQPLRRKLSCTEVGPSNDAIDIIGVSSLAKSEVIYQNTYEGVRSFRDDPIGRLFANGEITAAQYDAAAHYMADLDEVGGRLRASHRDELDISVWIPREPDSNALTGREIRALPNRTALDRIRAANNAMGREVTALLHATLASNATNDVEMLRAALDAIISSRKPQWTKPPEKSSTRSTSPSAALQESEF
jgi:hypothetical protein